MENEFDITPGVTYWRETKDMMLLQLADSIEELGKLPEEEELISYLTFLFVFSMGCRELKLNEESESFKKRADGVMAGLAKMGLKEGKFKNYVQDKLCSGLMERLASISSAKAAYAKMPENSLNGFRRKRNK